jgi:hypothetical protein
MELCPDIKQQLGELQQKYTKVGVLVPLSNGGEFHRNWRKQFHNKMADLR